jgi:hypothetical protein
LGGRGAANQLQGSGVLQSGCGFTADQVTAGKVRDAGSGSLQSHWKEAAGALDGAAVPAANDDIFAVDLTLDQLFLPRFDFRPSRKNRNKNDDK